MKAKTSNRANRLYRIWWNMKLRCYYPSHGGYKNYGAKGITICPEWLASFGVFEQWALQAGYQPDLTIDRLDSTKGYSPGNCTWSTYTAQNRRKSPYGLTVERAEELRKVWKSSNISMRDFAETVGIPHKTLWKLLAGFSWNPAHA